MIRLRTVVRLLRPAQWSKNAFVMVGLLFGHAWRDSDRVLAALVAFAAFCAIASAVYVINDWFDRERDRAHPRKRQRPIASGEVSGRAAGVLVLVLVTAAFALAFSAPIASLAAAGTPGAGLPGAAPGPAWLAGGGRLAVLLATYLALNIGYSLGIKHVPILDCAVIAAGFMLRILAGTWAIGIDPSRWLIVCSLSLTLFLAFSKRRAELEGLGDGAVGHRQVLEQYSLPLLDQFLAITATAVLVTYSVYTVSPDTIALHRTDKLFWTVPFVLYGLFRYLYIVFKRGAGGDPSRDVVRDPHMVFSALAWLGTTALVLRAAS